MLPLGSQEWSKVVNIYSQYATENNRITRETDSLKMKFRSLADSKKPTGEAVCPAWIREAKVVDLMIKERAVHNAMVDSENDEYKSDHES